MVAEMTPVRVQRSRKAGSKLPPNTVCVTRGRGMKWGNPFTIKAYRDAGYRGTDFQAATVCVAAFRAWMIGEPHWAHGANLKPPPDVSELRGKSLACWCPLSSPCHADVLLELANR